MNNDRKSKLSLYKKRWEELNKLSRQISVEIKFHEGDFLRGIIIDTSKGFLGFYERVSDDKMCGHTVPVMHVKSGKSVDDYFLKIYNNRFDKMWNEARDNL